MCFDVQIGNLNVVIKIRIRMRLLSHVSVFLEKVRVDKKMLILPCLLLELILRLVNQYLLNLLGNLVT